MTQARPRSTPAPQARPAALRRLELRPGPTRELVLASTSRWRVELLQRLGLPFETLAPGVDETPRPGETPAALASRLARAKAAAAAAQRPGATVIGADQVAEMDGQPLGKPGTHEAALRQWQAMRGRRVRFLTAVCVMRQQDGEVELGQRRVAVTVHCRRVDDATIDRYLRREQPYDCAGSARVEALGISMLEAVVSRDPTALVGLPLIATADLLRQAGWTLP